MSLNVVTFSNGTGLASNTLDLRSDALYLIRYSFASLQSSNDAR